MKKETLKKIILLPIVTLVVVGVIIGNVICGINSDIITGYLVPEKITYNTENVQEALNGSEEVIQQIAAEGITMLKNNGALPLKVDDEGYNVNMFGVGGTESEVNGFYIFGGGSGSVIIDKEDVVFLKEGLESAGFKVNQTLYNFFLENKANPSVSWWQSNQNILSQAKMYSDTAVVTISRFNGENCDDYANTQDNPSYSFSQPYAVEYTDNDNDGRNLVQLSLKEEAMIDYCAKNFENVIVIVNSGNVMELGYLDREDVDAVLYVPFPGQSGAKQIGNILSGVTNPSGHLTDTFVYDTKSDPTWANAIMLNQNGIQINYAEDIYVGYKWYETADYEGYFTAQGKKYDDIVWRPFGYGLSYTKFSWEVKGVTYTQGESAGSLASGDTLAGKDVKIQITVEVKNTGNSAGKEVVQLYNTPPYTEGGIEKAHVNLAAFEKTDMLYPASDADEDHPNSQIVVLEVDPYYLASYDAYNKNNNAYSCWELDGGEYHLTLRTDAHTVKDCAGADFMFKVPEGGFAWDTDPVSTGSVHNRFTGENAEANTPIDGNSNGEKITYMSRADFAGTFPTTRTPNRTSGTDLTKNGTYVTDEEYYADVERPELGSTATQHLLFTREDGSKATIGDLEYNAGASKIIPNEELIMKLGEDYDADEWDELLAQLTYADMAKIVAMCSQGTPAAESIGKPRDRVFDGPAGLTNAYLAPGMQEGDVSAFPCSALVGMTWNKELARQEGAAMGKEVSLVGIVGMYAPAVDLHRHAYNGRNFEQYGEDPMICGWMGAKVVYGMLTHGITGSVKHFVVSQPGKNPRDYNTWLTEQNLRENYLRPFEIAVKEGKANHIMTSFANVGGVRCAYSYQLNNGVLREEWGFKGSVITDWDVSSTSRTTASLIRSGNDLRFRGATYCLDEVSEDNDVDVYLLRVAAKNWLYSYCNMYYMTKTYDPNYTATYMTIEQPFVWWILVLVILDVVLIGGSLFLGITCFVSLKRKKPKATE